MSLPSCVTLFHTECLLSPRVMPCPGIQLLMEAYKLLQTFKSPYPRFEIRKPHILSSSVFKTEKVMVVMACL